MPPASSPPASSGTLIKNYDAKVSGWAWVFLVITSVPLILWYSQPIEEAGQQIPVAHQDVACLDEAGNRKELHYESFPNSGFEETFQDGCGTLIALPPRWGRHWQAQPATDDRTVHWHVYIREVGQRKYRGPYDLWSDADMRLQNPSLFYIQAAEQGVRIRFWTDIVH